VQPIDNRYLPVDGARINTLTKPSEPRLLSSFLRSRLQKRRAAYFALAAWVAVILAAVVPWTDYVGHSHWGKVQWIPFSSPPVKPIDIIANVLLYLPFGYLGVAGSGSRRRGWIVVGIAAVLSLLTEWTQVYSHYRFPSMQDALCNIAGAWLGAWYCRRRADSFPSKLD
jgi:glycopeptide antibiotics resistance protein